MWEFLIDIASAVAFIGFLPQMILTFKNRKALKDLSLSYQLGMIVALSALNIYSLKNRIWPSLVMNLIQEAYSVFASIFIYKSKKARETKSRA